MKWQGKSVLVTGADGFIGSHLSEMLAEQGARVRALVWYNSFNHRGWLDESRLQKEMEVVAGDIRDADFVQRLVEGCEFVFHLAALIAIPFSYIAPQSYVETNVGGTLNVCQAVRRGQARLLHTSTSEVYGSALRVPMDENHPLQPQSPYAASKVGADALVYSFMCSYNLPAVIARPFNTFGPRQSARAIIPTIIVQLLAGRQAIELGNVFPSRDFTFVRDTCQGLLELAACDAALGQTVNIGSQAEVSVGELFNKLKVLIGGQGDAIEAEKRKRPLTSEVARLLCDNSRLYELTGFKPRLTLEQGLRETISWFSQEEHLRQYRSGEYNL